jgi:hypothetical protein
MPEMITDDDAVYALDLVKTICTEVGPGLSGSPWERARAAVIQKELESHLGTENVAVEEFTFAPDAAFYGPLVSAVLMLIVVLLNVSMGLFTGIFPWVTSIAALVLSIFTPLLFIIEFIFNHEFVDRFYRKKQSLNVIGRLCKPGTMTVKRLLILSGHHDSAPENTWLRLLGYGFYFLTVTYFIGFITMLVMSIIQLTGLIMDSADLVRTGTLGWVMLVFPIAPSILYPMFLNRGRKDGGIVPGAADNLSASALAVSMCRFLVNNPSYLPADTEIRFISFGSEEAGLRGSRRYVARHLEELKRLDVRVLNFETVVHPEISILTSDLSGTVKNSPEMVQSVVAAAERAGVPHRLVSSSLGVANDSGPFSWAGLKGLTLLPFKIPQQLVAFYHQESDTPENLTIEPLLNVLKLSLEWINHRGE